MEITKALCLSTAHVKFHTIEWLDEKLKGSRSPSYLPFTVWRSEHGYFIPVYKIGQDGGAGLPGDLIDCMERAVTYDCEFLRLDSDGPVMKGLKTYDW